MRGAAKLMNAEVATVNSALESQMASFADAANTIGERGAAFEQAAASVSESAASLNTSVGWMLEDLGEATRLTDATRQSTVEAVFAANETASAVRETTRGAVAEAMRVAESIRSETAAMHAAAANLLSVRAPAPVAANDSGDVASLQVAANAAIVRADAQARAAAKPPRANRAGGGWGNFKAPHAAALLEAGAEGDCGLVDPTIVHGNRQFARAQGEVLEVASSRRAVTDGRQDGASAPARKRWSRREQQVIVSETFAPGETVASVARRHGASASMVSSWRKQAMEQTAASDKKPRGEGSDCARAPSSPLPRARRHR